ncbi:MAG: DnaJ C-terminal domain-containing protein [Actinomycetota bacterium]
MAQRDWLEKDYYKILGVSESASKDEIKKAYRKLAQKYHPDANSGDAEAESRFKEVSEAHAILSSDEKRQEYDQLRQFAAAGGERIYGFRPGEGGGVRINLEDLFGGEATGFEDLLGGFGFGRRGPQRGADAETEVALSFDQAVYGTMVSLADGTKVRIPAGISPGKRIRVRGRGEPGAGGGPAGDLYVRVDVAPHPVFKLGQNGDLSLTVPVTFPEAALGAKVEVPTLDDPVTVKIPAGTTTGKVLRVRGRGAPQPKGGRGDLLVKVEVQVPQKLSRRERQLLEELAGVQKDSPREYLAPYLKKTKAS